jgi:cytochrome c oxidase cbb3-type subunit 3
VIECVRFRELVRLREGIVRLSKGFALLVFVMSAGVVATVVAQAPAAGTPAGAPAQAAAPGAAGGRGGRGAAPAAPAAGGFGNAYPTHPQADPAVVAQGKAIYDANCASCHAPDARGSPTGINLLRSELVMDDQSGELIAPVVQNGRVDNGMPKFGLSDEQVSDVAAYIHSFRVAGYDLSRNVPTNIVVGDAKAGEAYFNGAGKCNTCHSVTGDLAGIGSKMDAKAIQNAFVSGRAGRGGFGPGGPAPSATSARSTVTATVTLANGKSVEGKLDHLDDFLVTITDENGNHYTFARQGEVPKVVVHNPLQAHIDMLPKYTDDDIHNLTAYLVTIK